ncbi:hypothetical protein [Curtobacterium sp. USHLN213]|uniref:hypothetical protein n=1 Tax=Curtobacterium sp. USHLN213 TaxID=3081255 RepID=UPI003019CB4F
MTAPKAKHHDFEKAEQWMQDCFGMSMLMYLKMGKRDAFHRAVRETSKVIALAGIEELLEQYWLEDHPSRRGRNAYMSTTSAMKLMFVTMRVKGTVSIRAGADLLVDATDEELEMLGIDPSIFERGELYDAYWRAVHRFKDLLDRDPGPRWRRPSPARLAEIKEEFYSDPERLELLEGRMMTICNQLLQGTWLLLPKELRDRMHGTAAIDATVIPVAGMQKNLERMTGDDTASVNYGCGFYVREGDHDGTNSAPGKRIFGREAELGTLTRNSPGADIDAPLFIIWFGGHKPGEVAGQGKRFLDSCKERGIPITTVIADRAYLPGAKSEDFQLPIATSGANAVMDYPHDKLGIQAYYASKDGKHDLVMCDGSWYPSFMPQALKLAESTWAKTRIAASQMTNPVAREAKLAAGHDLVTKRREQRAKYRLKPRGRHNADGSRQYFYPTGLDSIDFDTTTGEKFDTPIPGKTVKIPGSLVADKRNNGDGTKHLKFGQEFEYKSEEWRGWYGLRNTIESVNSRVKDPQAEGLHDPLNRRGRGPWFAEIAAALAAASQNLRRLIHFLQDRLALKRLSAKNRNHWMTYAKQNPNARVQQPDATEANSEPPEYYLIPIDELLG